MKPSLGRVVLYVLTESDAEAINRRRSQTPAVVLASWPEGAQRHVGRPVSAGDVFAADVCRVWADDVFRASYDWVEDQLVKP